MSLKGGAVAVSDGAQLADDDLVIASGMVGSPAITSELLPTGDEFTRAFRALEHHLGRRAKGVFALEGAGVNFFPPILVAARLGLPLLDFDAMGRAYPRLDHTVLHAAGLNAGPLAGASVTGEAIILDVTDGTRAEELARATMAPFGGWAACACYPLSAAALRTNAIAGGIARALRFGHDADHAQHPGELARAVGARQLGEGRVLEVSHAGGGRGSVLIASQGSHSTLRLELQTEYLLALCDGAVVAATPEPIVVLDRHTLDPISCESIHHGLEVSVIALPASAEWSRPGPSRHVDPQAFGYQLGDGDD